MRDTYTFNFPGAPPKFVDVFRRYYGPTMNALRRVLYAKVGDGMKG